MPVNTVLSRRRFLRGVGLSGAAIRIGLPALDAMFNESGTAYAASGTIGDRAIESRFVYWFNGNGIPEKYWIPRETSSDFQFTPCLNPLAPFRRDIHIITGLDSPAARLPGPGNSHYPSMSALVSGQVYTGRGAGGPSIDQVVAGNIGRESRFRSLQIGVCQESFGESIQRNLSWAGRDRPLPPEMIPHQLFDRLFGSKEAHWVNREKSILDAVQEDTVTAPRPSRHGPVNLRQRQVREENEIGSAEHLRTRHSGREPRFLHERRRAALMVEHDDQARALHVPASRLGNRSCSCVDKHVKALHVFRMRRICCSAFVTTTTSFGGLSPGRMR